LHNPKYFQYLKPLNNIKSLVFSGHLHGGQIGLLNFPYFQTLSIFSFIKWPADGFWCKSNLGIFRDNSFNCIGDKLYVHRGFGFYGFPLRFGIWNEESILEIKF
jgi:predicted MPP superfamily phosphohydrolase